MMNASAQRLEFILSGLLALIWVWATRHDPFFWDTVQLASKHAHFFFDNGLVFSPLPTEIDSGHPPLFGYYLAFCWKIFGKTLPVSHAAMWPFLTLFFWLLLKTGRHITGDKRGYWLLPIVCMDPVWAGQSVLVSPDIVLMTGLAAALYGFWANKVGMQTLGVFLLSVISLRGMMVAAGFAIFVAANSQPVSLRRIWKVLLPFLPGALSALAFLIWHRQATGWSGQPESSPWGPAFERVGWGGFMRNAAVLIWRWVDFGRIFEIAAFFILWRRFRQSVHPGFPKSLTLTISLALPLCGVALAYSNLSAHRYLLPVFFGMHLAVFTGLLRTRRLPFYAAILSVLLASGNFWIWPRGVAMGWDSTLAHLSYHQLHAEALQWIDAQNIDLQDVGTCFPALNSGEDLFLNGDERSPAPYEPSHNRYVLASNVFNDLQADDLDRLEQSWRLIWRKQNGSVWMAVYSRQGLRSSILHSQYPQHPGILYGPFLKPFEAAGGAAM